MNFLSWTPSPQNLGFLVVHQYSKEAWKLASIESMFLVASIIVSSVKRCSWYQQLLLKGNLFLTNYDALQVPGGFCWEGPSVLGLLAFQVFEEETLRQHEIHIDDTESWALRNSLAVSCFMVLQRRQGAKRICLVHIVRSMMAHGCFLTKKAFGNFFKLSNGF